MDSRGVGDPVEDMLRNRLQRYGIRVEGWVPSPKNNDITGKELERELKAQPPRLFFPAQESREQRRFIEQMLDCEKVYSGNLLKLTHPNRRGAHDDYVKSLEYGLHASLERGEPGYGHVPNLGEGPLGEGPGFEELESIDWLSYPPGE